MSKNEIKNIFVEGAVAADFIAADIDRHSRKTGIGAHSIFLGQVRADEIDGNTVAAIEYTAYTEMALQQMQVIREDLFAKYELTCLHVYHSLGIVRTGEICLFVFASAKHRKAAIDACEEAVDRIKSELPVWGKEIFGNETSRWKTNR